MSTTNEIVRIPGFIKASVYAGRFERWPTCAIGNKADEEREKESDLDFDERHKSARSRVRDDKNYYARAKRSSSFNRRS